MDERPHELTHEHVVNSMVRQDRTGQDYALRIFLFKADG